MLHIKLVRRGFWGITSSILLMVPAVVPVLSGQAMAAPSLALDKQVSTHASSGKTATSPAFTTTQANELLVAFISSDGSGSAKQTVSSVTTTGLTWRLRERANAQSGTAEIWTAAAPSTLTGATVKATYASSVASSITVASFIGADTSATAGAAAGNSASTGASTVSLTTTAAGSWTWAAGDDFDNAKTRTVGANQTKADEYLPSVGDTYWVQRQTNPSVNAGTVVTMNDTAPTNDRWNLAALEIVPATPTVPVVDTTAPSVPQNLNVTSFGYNQVALGWNASTDDSGIAPNYSIFRDGTQLATNITATTYTDTTVAAGTSYDYTVRAYDGSGNVSTDSNVASVTTGTPDTTAPSVTLTSPTDGANASGTVTLGATATDDVAVKNVQFQLTDLSTGAVTNIGSPVTSAPYQFNWNSGTVANGQYAISAVATDTSGNTATSNLATITVTNTAPLVPTLDPSTPAPTGVPRNVSSVDTAAFSPPANTVLYASLSLDQLPNQKTVVGSITNSGTPLTWHLMGRENHGNGGDVEVWWAYNATAQTNMTVTTNFSLPSKDVVAPLGDIQIFVFNNAAPDQSAAATATNWLTDGTGNKTPNVTITPTVVNSRIYAVFDNWNYNGKSIIPGTDQTNISQILNATDVDSYWDQQKTTPTVTPGTPVLMNATLGGVNEWHAMAWEVLPLVP